jgi:hypothetical protein
VTANAQTEPGEPELRITHILDAPRASLRGVGQFRTPEALVRPQRLHRVGLRNGFALLWRTASACAASATTIIRMASIAKSCARADRLDRHFGK